MFVMLLDREKNGVGRNWHCLMFIIVRRRSVGDVNSIETDCKIRVCYRW